MLDPVTLDQLRVLIAVAEAGSFSAAARRLGRVQSAISQSVQALETGLGTPLFDREGRIPALNDAGRILLADARKLVSGVDQLKARAQSISEDVEPELTLAVDALFPTAVLASSVRSLTKVFPDLPITLFTEVIGGAEQRLRDGSARIGLYSPLPGISDGRDMEFLIDIPFVPVAAADHPLARHRGVIPRAMIENEVQLVLMDSSQLGSGVSGGVISERTWRFADLATRLDFLLAGFGWCNMPLHMVVDLIAREELCPLSIEGYPRRVANIHVVHERGRPPGKAGRWLIEELRKQVKGCGEPHDEMMDMIESKRQGGTAGLLQDA